MRLSWIKGAALNVRQIDLDRSRQRLVGNAAPIVAKRCASKAGILEAAPIAIPRARRPINLGDDLFRRTRADGRRQQEQSWKGLSHRYAAWGSR